jgi:hypothetical protein
LFGLTYKGRVEGAHAFVVTDPRWRQYWCSDCVACLWCRLVIYRSPRHFQDLTVRAHEAAHVRQSRQLGLLLYPVVYTYYHYRKGYYLNPFEVAARQAAAKRVQHSVERLRVAGLQVQRRSPRPKRRESKVTKVSRVSKVTRAQSSRGPQDTRRVRKTIYFR